MSELQVFSNAEFGSVRSITVNGEPYFVGKDVAEILGYANTRDALAKHVDEEDRMDGVAIRDSIGREQTPVLINESGLYSLILSSKLPSAKRFKRWVTSEVLPAIRRHGVFLMDDIVNNTDALIEAEERAARAAAAYRPLVYICSPYAGDVEKNTFRARAFSRFAVERHCIPIAPHLLCPQYLDEETERWLGLKMGIVFMGKCEEVWVFGDTVSEGMAAEIEKARKLRKKIRYFTDDLREKEGMAG